MPEQWPTASLDGHPISETWKSRIVRVSGYGGDFNSIQTAINYCVTQTPTAVNRWTVEVYPGTYNEQITLAQYVDVVGIDKESVIIPVTNLTAVTMADDTRIADLTINALATAGGSAYCIDLADSGCRIEDINMYIDRDVTGGLECVGIIEDANNTAKTIYIRNVRIVCEQVINTNTHGVSIRQANKTIRIEECYISGSDYGMSIGISGGAAVASTIWSKQNFFMATAAVARAVHCNGGEIWLHEDSINRGCYFHRENDGLIIYTDGNENYHVFEGMSIQDALDNIPAAGCEIRVHDGTYAITDPITITQNNTVLQGDGPNTFIDGDGLATGEHGIVISGVTGVRIRNLSIQTEDGGGKICHCIFVEDGANETHIDDIRIVNSDSDGIHIEGTTMYDVHVHDCHIAAADGYGIFVDMDAANFFYRGHFTDNMVLGTGSSGIFLGNTGAGNWYCEVNNNLVATAGGQGIQALEMYHSDLSNNILISNTSDGIILGTSGHTNLEGNQCYDNGSDGIELATTTECNVTGNTCTGNTNSGIFLDGASDLNVVNSNHCCGNTMDGIRCGGTRVSIDGNFCYENTQHGISIGNPECSVTSNYCYDNSQTAETYHGINVGNDADRAQINDNYCNSPGDSQEDGIHLVDGASECQIVGNHCYNGMGSGIALMANNDHCLVKDNYCSENDDYGVEIAAATCNHNVVENNELVGNVNGQMSDGGTDTMLPTIFVPVPNPSTNIGEHPAELLTDGLAVTSRFNLHIHANFQELVTAQVIIVPGGTGNLRRAVATDYGKLCSEVYNTHSEALADDTNVAVTINVLECVDISGALTGILANDQVGIAFTRHGENALDTVGANCYLLGLRVRHV